MSRAIFVPHLSVSRSTAAALPGTAATTELFSGLWQGGDEDQSVPTSVAGLAVLGWLIFGLFMSDATGADAEDVRLRLPSRWRR